MSQTSHPLLVIPLILSAHHPGATLWNDTGHRLVAVIAFEQLSESERSVVIDILRSHPRFSTDFNERMPESIRQSPQDMQGRWIFAHAATWPDIAREFTGEAAKRYHHPTWHFVNCPVYRSEADKLYLESAIRENLQDDWKEGMDYSAMNVVQALKMCKQRLAQEETKKPEKAVYLCWLLHLAGDIHQPLHCSDLFTREQFPSGDQGGNKITLGSDSLHSYWDGSLGSEQSLEALISTVRELLTEGDIVNEATKKSKTLAVAVWRDESYQIARSYAYTDEILNDINGGKRNEHGAIEVDLPSAYGQQASALARRQAAIAGFRLAHTIEAVISFQAEDRNR